jgi:signal transduction histidine kinase
MRVSISTRLLIVTTLTVMLALPAAGALLSDAFRRAVGVAHDQRLQALVETLAARLEAPAGGGLQLRGTVTEARYAQVYSGWYWQVVQRDRVVATSRSLWDASLDVPPLSSPLVQGAMTLRGPMGEALRGYYLRLQLAGSPAPVELVVTEPHAALDAEVTAFNRLLWWGLGTLGGLLLLLFAVQVRWGLRPLRRMREDLEAVRDGAKPQLDTALPPDLAGLAETLNDVLAHQVAVVTRGRTVAGNLAHALKQPLATLRLAAAEAAPDRAVLRRALSEIDATVDHHLARAAAGGAAGGRYRRVDLRQTLMPVVEAVRALHGGRGKVIDAALPDDVGVSMEAQDLQELVGNLLDNAGKWAASRVRLSARADEDHIVLWVDDDGPGLRPDQRDGAMQRGVRWDERQPGSGLGLAIVQDLVALYEWRLALEDSPSGGLRARLTGPAPRVRRSAGAR